MVGGGGPGCVGGFMKSILAVLFYSVGTRISSPWRIRAARCCKVTYWLSTVSYSLRLA